MTETVIVGRGFLEDEAGSESYYRCWRGGGPLWPLDAFGALYKNKDW